MSIPDIFDQPGASFVLIPAGIKFPPVEDGWQTPEKTRSYADAQQHVASGGNVGIRAGGGYIGLDQDDMSAFTGIDSLLPTTTRWETRPGRVGLWFRCEDYERVPEILEMLGKKPDLAQLYLYKNGEHVGEIKLQKSYQVIPPSIKFIDRNTGKDSSPGSVDADSINYKMLNECPPASISLEWLIGTLLKNGIKLSKRKDSIESEKNADPTPKTQSKSVLSDVYADMEREIEVSRKKAYAEAAFESEVSTLATTKEGDRNKQLNDTVFRLAWFMENGYLDGHKASDIIYQTALQIGLDDSEILPTMNSAYQAGRGVARALGEEPANSTTMTTPTTTTTDIYINNRYLKEMTDEVLAALVGFNDPPTIFCRAGSLVRTHENGSVHIEPMTIDSLKNKMSLAAGFRRSIGNNSSIKVTPPNELAAAILALDAWPGIKEIKRVIETPTVRPDGSILSKNGYDEVTQLYLDPIVDISGIDIPETPTVEHGKASAKYILNEIFSDFPFENEASRANTLALLLSVVVRPLIAGNVPMTIIDKPQAGTGASLITDIIATITTGKPASMWGMPENEDEWRKSITGALMSGSPIIVIDNVVGKLKSSALTRALTSQIWRDRVLGKNHMIDLPQESVWIATGNNIQIGGDIARRSMWIRLDAACARPWTRAGFKHSDILSWIKENQDVIIAYLLIMARAWIVNGRPEGSILLGGFTGWSKTISGILEFCGVENFLGNATQLYDEMDQDVQQWDAFLTEWSVLHGDNAITARSLVDELTSTSPIYLTLKESMPDDIAKSVNKDRKASLSIGQILRKHLNQVYPSGRKLVSTKDAHTKIVMWSIAGIPEKTDPHQATTTRVLQVLNSYSSRESTGNEGICVYNKSRDSTPAIHAEMATVIEQENEEIPAETTDSVEVIFTTVYQTDMDGKMVEFREGEKTMIEKRRAETWQKRGIVRIEQQQQRQGAQ